MLTTMALTGSLVMCGQSLAAKKGETPAASTVSSVPLADTLAVSRQVDKFIEAGYAEHNVKPNGLASDEVFLRRVYLDIIGRVPTYEEAKAFLDSTDAQKRSKLIDRLLDSEGYVSHQFNWFADMLRLQSRMRYSPAAPYLDFVKESLRQNKPYDQVVQELLTSEGYTWDNGAAGYYIRDVGMPLDNLSNTVQVFLGTQLVCAQCHNHPYDSWTQMQYYQLAAFVYGVDTRDRNHEKYAELRKMRGEMDQEMFRAANRILQPLAYRVNETNRALTLPHDYQYSDAKPRSRVDPKTIFGEDVVIKPGDSRQAIFARWLTSTKNPRFTTVISNRLWKRVMGAGLIEPVDDFKDGAKPSNPALMAYLDEQMLRLDYDMKQYLRILFNTKTYQREVATEELVADEPYHFPGPVLRRMSAEQLWDSLLAMTVPAIDERKGIVQNNGRYSDGEELVGMEMSEILEMAKVEAQRRTAQTRFLEQTREMQEEMRVAVRTGDTEKASKLRAEVDKVRREIFGETTNRRGRTNRQREPETDPRWKGFNRDLVRASEVESPARPGHFLRQFGQSDRETIENANTEANVPQILTLLNGPIYSQLLSRNSVLSAELAKASTPEEKLEVLFLSILSRRPSQREIQLTLPSIKDGGSQGVEDIVWALLNTRQYMFVQ